MAKKSGGKRKNRGGEKKAEILGSVRVFQMEVENPLFQRDHAESKSNHKRIIATVNMNESPVMRMYAKGNLDVAQLRAANRIRQLFEMAGGANIQAMDYTKEPVDGGSMSDGLTDAKLRAAVELDGIRTRMGPVMYELVEAVCARCVWLKDIEPDRARRDRARLNLLAGLTVAAKFWGYQTEIRYWRKDAG